MTNRTDPTMDEALGLEETLTESVRPLTNYEDVLLMHAKFERSEVPTPSAARSRPT